MFLKDNFLWDVSFASGFYLHRVARREQKYNWAHFAIVKENVNQLQDLNV